MIHHIYSDYQPKDPDTQIRHMVARKTWSTQPWQDRGIKDTQVTRAWNEEGRSFPFLKDIWNLGCEGLPGEDIAVFTNTDICVPTNCCARIAEALQGMESLYAYRTDFHHQFIKPIPDEDVPKGVKYAGSDLYAFRVRWWREWREIFPDLILGMEGWDPCMRTLIEQSNPGAVVELEHLCYHQRHASFWEAAENRNRLAGQKHNLSLEFVWLSNLGVDPRRFGIRVI